MGGPVMRGYVPWRCSIAHYFFIMDAAARDLHRLLAEVEQGAINQGPEDEPARDEGSVRGKFFFLPFFFWFNIVCDC